MIISLKNNRALLRSVRRNEMEREVRHHASGPIIYENKMAPAALESFRARLRRERRMRDIAKISALMMSLGIAVAVIFLMFRALLRM